MEWYQWFALFGLIGVGGGYGYWKFVLGKKASGSKKGRPGSSGRIMR
jgi:dipeptide/tripeptide permease